MQKKSRKYHFVICILPLCIREASWYRTKMQTIKSAVFNDFISQFSQTTKSRPEKLENYRSSDIHCKFSKQTLLAAVCQLMAFLPAHLRQTNTDFEQFKQWRSDGGAGRTGRHLLGAAKGRKTPKI